MFFVEDDGSYRFLHTHREADSLPSSRVYGSLLGARQHPMGVPVTPIRSIRAEGTWDAATILKHEWNMAGVPFTGSVTVIELEDLDGEQPARRTILKTT